MGLILKNVYSSMIANILCILIFLGRVHFDNKDFYFLLFLSSLLLFLWLPLLLSWFLFIFALTIVFYFHGYYYHYCHYLLLLLLLWIITYIIFISVYSILYCFVLITISNNYYHQRYCFCYNYYGYYYCFYYYCCYYYLNLCYRYF